MPRRKLTPETIEQWTNDIYRHHILDSYVRLSDCLQSIWDLRHDDAMMLIRNHGPALEVATIQGCSILRTAYTIGWLDIESGKSIILASLGSREGDDVG